MLGGRDGDVASESSLGGPWFSIRGVDSQGFIMLKICSHQRQISVSNARIPQCTNIMEIFHFSWFFNMVFLSCLVNSLLFYSSFLGERSGTS